MYMLAGKKSRPAIGSLTGSWFSGYRVKPMEVATSPRSPLESRILQLPISKGFHNKFDDVGEVGLGIVAALQKSAAGEIQTRKVFSHSQNLCGSDPIPVNSTTGPPLAGRRIEETEMSEDFTYVTRRRRGGANKSYTKVYYVGGVEYSRSRNVSIFEISPASYADDVSGSDPNGEFLSSCQSCHKSLDGRDIYMYRGDRAFCSSECRQRQMMMDERKVQSGSQAFSRSSDVSNSSHLMFLNGILAI